MESTWQRVQMGESENNVWVRKVSGRAVWGLE